MKTKLLFLFFAVCRLTNAQNITADFYAPSVCLNNPTCFTDLSVSNDGAIVQWAWNFGDGTNSATQNPCHTFAVSGTYTVTLMVTSINGNTATIARPVIIHPLPTSTLMLINGCFGSPTCLSNIVSISSGSITDFYWNFGDPNSGADNNSHLQNPCHTFSSVNNFLTTLIVTTDKGCKDTILEPISVHDSPVANFSSASSNGSVVFTDLSTVANGNIASWIWVFPGGTPSMSLLQNPLVAYPPGDYSACLTVISNYGCKDTLCLTITIASVNDTYPETVIHISPNPLSTHATLETEKPFKDATLTVYNSYGQLVKQLKNVSGQEITLHRDNLPVGLYFIRLEQENRIFSINKLVITDN